MSEKFKCFYLVCLDHGDDINYVVARNPSLKEARGIAEKAKKEWPSQKVYITLEKVPAKNPFGQVTDSLRDLDLDYSYTKKKNPVNDRCICGGEYGACVGELSCRCNPLAKCKRVDKVTEKPLPFQEDTVAPRRRKPKLSKATLQIEKVYRGVTEVKIPEWAPDEIFGITYEEIPNYLHASLKPGVTFEVLASLDIQNPDDMVIEFVQTNPAEEFDEEEFDDLDEDEEEEEDDEDFDDEEDSEEDLDDGDEDSFDEDFDEDEESPEHFESDEEDDEDFDAADEEDYQENPSLKEEQN